MGTAWREGARSELWTRGPWRLGLQGGQWGGSGPVGRWVTPCGDCSTGSAERLSPALESGRVHTQEASGPGLPVGALRHGHTPWPPRSLPDARSNSRGAWAHFTGQVAIWLEAPSLPSRGFVPSWSLRVPPPPALSCTPSAEHQPPSGSSPRLWFFPSLPRQQGCLMFP